MTNTDIPRRGRRSSNAQAEGDDEESSDEEDNNETSATGGHPNNILRTNLETMSVSCLGGYKSSILWLYKEANLSIAPEISTYLDEAISGYKTIFADKKERGIMRLQEGRNPLDFSGYMSLAALIAGLDSTSSPFGWVYCLLTWNLMCRSNNTAKIHLNHIIWKNDCISVTFCKTKTDQSGEKKESNEKHIYANPLIPEICPVLALAVWVFSRNFSNENRHDNLKLFEGHEPNKRFEKLFAKILTLLPEDSPLKSQIRDLGVHSERKGSTTYVLALSMAISAIAVYLRAGWSVGSVQDRYIFAGAGYDLELVSLR